MEKRESKRNGDWKMEKSRGNMAERREILETKNENGWKYKGEKRE